MGGVGAVGGVRAAGAVGGVRAAGAVVGPTGHKIFDQHCYNVSH